jgi:hypothetical protein
VTIKIAEETVIARPRADVAAFMFDPRNDAEWTTGVIESRPRQKGQFKAGARVLRTLELAGKRIEFEYRVIDADSDSFVEIEVDHPIPMHIRYELETVPKGTLTRISASGDPTGVIGIATPILKLMAKRSVKSDLKRLKQCVESAKPRRKR